MPIALFVVATIVASAAAAQTPAEQPVKPGNGVSAPSVLSEVKPEYPARAISTGIEGVVTLEAVVETNGSVGDVRVLKPVHPMLDESAIAALKQWKFRPGVRDGKPVRVAVEVEMSFTTRADGPRLDSADVVKPGPGVTMPTLLKDVKPSYTAAAVQARTQGSVAIDCIVLPDGRVGDVRVTKKLDPELDAEAIRVLKQWRFSPGKRNGEAVPVQITVELTFTLAR